MKAVAQPGHSPRTDTPLALPFDAAWALFLDVDGTLLEHADDPLDVIVSADFAGTLSELFSASGGAIALVSGRRIADVDRIFARPTLPCAGQHGLEIRFPDGRIDRQDAVANLVQSAYVRLRPKIAALPGVVLENKGLSLTLHYRRAPRARAEILHIATDVMCDLDDSFQLMDSKHAVELKPRHTNKGTAIIALMQVPPFSGRVPIFFGDDRTDEDGFAVVNALSGHSVKVGIGPTVAGMRVADPGTVRLWLAAYAEHLRRKAGR